MTTRDGRGAHLSRKSFLGLYEVVALAGCLAALVLFRVIGRAVALESTLARLDVAVEAAVHRHLPSAVRHAAEVITWAGNGTTVLGLAVTVAVVLLAARRHVWLVGWAGGMLGASALSIQLKNHYARPRPLFAYELHPTFSFSYPSAHALGSIVAYGLIAYMVARLTHNPRRRAAAITAAVLLVLAISASRVMLRVHFLSDVVGGLLIGGAWLALCVLGLERAWHRPWSTPAEREEEQHTAV